MTRDVETVVTAKTNMRISVSNFDDHAWIHMGGRHATMHTTLTVEEATQLRDGLQLVLDHLATKNKVGETQ